MSIKTIWFDLGNVILDFDFTPAYKKLETRTGLSSGSFENYFRQRPQWEALSDKGGMTIFDLYHQLKKDLNFDSINYRRFKLVWNDIFVENKRISALVRALKRNGYRLILISNTNRLHYEHVSHKYPVIRCFHKTHISYQHKMRKPEHKFYRSAYRLSKAKPHEILYIDDKREFTDLARVRCGVHTHTFKGAAGLEQKLRQLGVRFR